jgi:hypothetical protein
LWRTHKAHYLPEFICGAYGVYKFKHDNPVNMFLAIFHALSGQVPQDAVWAVARRWAEAVIAVITTGHACLNFLSCTSGV